jgi:hypothetical protein
MTLHFHQEYQCVKCETYFLPYQSPVTLCPECSEPNLQSEDFREIIKLLVDANLTHRRLYGRCTPPAYGIFSLVDHYVYYTATLFDLFIEQQTPRALLIEEAVADETSAWKEHLRELLYQVFEQAERQGLFKAQPGPAEEETTK